MNIQKKGIKWPVLTASNFDALGVVVRKKARQFVLVFVTVRQIYQHPENVFFFPLSGGWSLIDESNCVIFTTDKRLSAPSALIKTVGTFSNETHLATFPTLTADFLLGKDLLCCLPQLPVIEEVLKHSFFCDLDTQRVNLCLIIALTGQSKKTFCDLLCPLYVFFWSSGQKEC